MEKISQQERIDAAKEELEKLNKKINYLCKTANEIRVMNLNQPHEICSRLYNEIGIAMVNKYCTEVDLKRQSEEK